jgi:hypothetical protein
VAVARPTQLIDRLGGLLEVDDDVVQARFGAAR